MNAIDIVTIEERIARLERRVRRGSRIATAMMLLLALLIAWNVLAYTGRAWLAGWGAKDLVARSLRIVDARGTSRLHISLGKYGPVIALADENQRLRIAVGFANQGPGLELFDENEKGRLQLSLVKEGPILILGDENGHRRVNLIIGKEGPALELFDEKRNLRAVLGSTSLTNFRTGAEEITAPSSLTLFDSQPKLLWRAP
jgi:hypothetical protein